MTLDDARGLLDDLHRAIRAMRAHMSEEQLRALPRDVRIDLDNAMHSAHAFLLNDKPGVSHGDSGD